MQKTQIADAVRILHTDPMRELGIAVIRGIVVEVFGPDRAGIEKIMIKSRGGKYHQVTAAAVQLSR
jgi:hypothetical protein